MRRVLLGDIVAAVCGLAAAAQDRRGTLAQQWLAQADAAHRYMKRTGRAHGDWGTDTLEARARKSGELLAFDLGNAQVLDALRVLSSALEARKTCAEKRAKDAGHKARLTLALLQRHPM
jgi:hypothetical protein